jgi:glyoxylase-like metal-dependent hydrolase (beta-lactamase superfamily II)
MSLLNIETIPLGPIQTNCFILWPEGESSCWIVDPGGLPGPILKIIDATNLRPEMIINTHGHWDHFMGNRSLKDKFPDLPLAIHEADADVLPDSDKNLSLFLIGKEIVSPPANRFLKDGDELPLGSLMFKVIHTPGHTPGGVCLYCAKAKTVIVGDLIFAGGGVGRTDFPGASQKQLTESITKLFVLLPEDTTVYPGHGPSTTIGEEKANLGF